MPFPSWMLYHDGTPPEHNPETHEAEGKWSVEFEENFSDLEVGSEPENLFILDGAYAVSQEENDKSLPCRAVRWETSACSLGPGFARKA